MTAAPIPIDASAATRIVRDRLDPSLTVTTVRRMHGGVSNAVYEWLTDGQPAAIVAKLAPPEQDAALHQEFAALRWYRQHTRLAVPEPYVCVSGGEVFDQTCLLMRRLPGRNLGEAKLSPRGKRVLQQQFALQIAELHRHRRDTYGNALGGETYIRWLDRFAPVMRHHFDTVRDRLAARTRWVVSEVLEHLDQWLPESNQPTLVHGDLWANNIIVDDLDTDRPTLAGFIDGGVNYSEVEYELAYLRIFNTADATFFETYCQTHPLRSGFEQRSRIYWLNTAMTHVTTFGPSYLSVCDRVADQIAKVM